MQHYFQVERFATDFLDIGEKAFDAFEGLFPPSSKGASRVLKWAVVKNVRNLLVHRFAPPNVLRTFDKWAESMSEAEKECEMACERCLSFLNGEHTPPWPYDFKQDVEPYEWEAMGPYFSLACFEANLKQCRANDKVAKSWARNLHNYLMSCSGREFQKFVDALRLSIPDEPTQAAFVEFMWKFAHDEKEPSDMLRRMIELCELF